MNILELVIGQLYSNDEIFKSLGVANAGGVRLSVDANTVRRAVVMTSDPSFHRVWENPYHDRIEGAILTYTAAGKFGQQILGGANSRLIEQRILNFPIHGFALVASRRDKSVGSKRWRYLGLLEYLRHYPDTQLDANGKVRRVWLFEFKIHDQQQVLPINADRAAAGELLEASRLQAGSTSDDDQVIGERAGTKSDDVKQIEQVRGRLLALQARAFEFFIKDLLVHCGFEDVCVTKFSADGGIDVNARTSGRIWLFENTAIQIQAKRWLHAVGRKEVAELRGSLQPFARGAVLTTSHFSKAAVNEAQESGKNPITLVDGYRLSKVVLDERFPLQ